MAFMNKKEQVVDIQLTSYGRRLLSEGSLKPIFYAFYDDDILYDIEATGQVEPQNEAQARITGSLSFDNQVNYAGAETTIQEAIKQARAITPEIPDSEFISVQNPIEKDFALYGSSLGTSKSNSQYAPSWRINAYRSEIDNATAFLTGTLQSMQIPQLNVNINCEVRKIKDLRSYDEATLSEYDVLAHYPDDSAILLKKKDVILDVYENNGVFDLKNFDIEVFAVTGALGDTTCHYPSTPYYFVKERSNVYEIPNVDPNYVEYFLEILVDNEIDQDVLCNLKIEDPAQGVFDKRAFDCEDVTPRVTNENVYGINQDYEEPCDD